MTTKNDYVRTYEIEDAAVRVSDLPALFNAARSTIDAWIRADNLVTFPHPAWDGNGRAPLAIRWGDVLLHQHPTRWTKKPDRKSN